MDAPVCVAVPDTLFFRSTYAGLLPYNADGGNDALPYEINEQARDPSTRVFVCADAEEDRLQALMACQVRGQVLWLWGARTREERRGQGLAKQLMVNAILLYEISC